MASKKIRCRELIQQVVQERGGVSVGALADMLGVSTQTIRRDLDMLCDGENLRRVHGRIELAEDRLNTPFDQRAGTNLIGRRAIAQVAAARSEEHTSELQSLMRSSYAVFCLKKKTIDKKNTI